MMPKNTPSFRFNAQLGHRTRQDASEARIWAMQGVCKASLRHVGPSISASVGKETV